jgi:hypothetical protein
MVKLVVDLVYWVRARLSVPRVSLVIDIYHEISVLSSL